MELGIHIEREVAAQLINNNSFNDPFLSLGDDETKPESNPLLNHIYNNSPDSKKFHKKKF